MADRSPKPLKSSELEEDARRENAPRGTGALKESSDEESDLRKREEQAVETSLTRLPPG